MNQGGLEHVTTECVWLMVACFLNCGVTLEDMTKTLQICLVQSFLKEIIYLGIMVPRLV
jgi:hypothetical protein